MTECHWINLDPFLDVEYFHTLREELDKGVRLAKRRAGSYVGDYISIRLALKTSGKHDPQYCEWHPNSSLFPEFLKFVSLLPFVCIGRILIFTEHTEPHRDGGNQNEKDGFIWMRVGGRRFWVEGNGGPQFVTSTFAWFDSRLLHGGVKDQPHESYSLRVDGVFTPEFKQMIGVSHLQFNGDSI